MPRIVLSLLLALSCASSHAATLQLCPGTPLASPGALSEDFIAPDGTRMRAIVTEEAGKPLPNCRVIDLGVGTTGIQAMRFLARDADPGRTILLQGVEGKGRASAFEITEHTIVPDQPPPAPPAPMPFARNLLDAMTVRAFGLDERVQASLEDGRLRVTCSAGERPAGVLLTGPWLLPRADGALRATYTSTGRFGWQVADAKRAARDTALDMGELRRAANASADLRPPQDLDRSSWRQFTLVCPREPAVLTLDELTLLPAAMTDPLRAPRATWAWSPNEWRERGEDLLIWAMNARIGEVFISVPLGDGRVQDADALGAFVRRAGERGIAVSAVEGDPQMVLPAEQAATVARAAAYAAYNAAAAPEARLKSVQFDVEPYLLPSHVLPREEQDRHYLALAAKLRAATGTIPLDFVVPYWWHDKAALLRELARHADRLTVMDYRTDPDQIYRLAAPFLDWGVEYGKQVRIALEAGPIGAETQRRYQRTAPGAPGDLLLFEVDGHKILLLLKVPAPHPQATTYLQSGARPIDGSATTFHTDKSALERLLPALERTFGAWKSFAGIALHEFR